MSARTNQHPEKLLTRILSVARATASRALSRTVGIEPPQRSAMVLDELEQRVLYSATPVPAPADAEACVVCEVPEQAEVAEQATTRVQLVVVDASVANHETLLAGLTTESDANFEVVMLDSNQDGIEQITNILSERSNVEALHIVSHGEDGTVQLGSSVLSNQSLAAYSGMFAQWDSSFTSDADILFYGCDLGGSADGLELVQSLSILTGADVAASDDLTGHAELDGDWDLEVGVGEIETQIAFSEVAQASWYGILSVPPTLTISNGATTQVDTSVAIDDTGISFSLSADGSVTEIEATLAVDHGSLTLSDTSNLTLVSGDWFVGSTMTIRGSVSDVATAMTDLVYTPDTNWAGTAIVSASVDDLIGGVDSDTLAITVARPFDSAGTTTHADSGLSELNRGIRRGVTRSISTNADGTSVAAWTVGSQSFWEVFGSDGASLGSGTLGGVDARHVSVAMDPSSTTGNFVATWTVGTVGSEAIEIQRFDLTGASTGALLRTTIPGVAETNPSIAMNAAGDYAVVWESGNGNLRFERFDSSDQPIDGGSIVVPNSAGAENPAIGIDADRNLLISWDDSSGQHFTRYDGSFNKTTLSTATFASGSAIGMNDAGQAVIAWHYNSGGWNIAAQRIDADGNLIGAASDVPANTAGDELNPSVSIDQAGNYTIAWEGANQIQMRQFTPSGVGGSDIRVDTNSVYDANASVSVVDEDNIVVLYTRDGGNPDILSRRFTTSAADVADPDVSFSQSSVLGLHGTTVSLDALLSDPDTVAGDLNLAFSSSRTDIVDASLIAESGTAALRTLTIPIETGVTGTATITVTITDGNGGISTNTFDVVAVDGIQVTTTADESDGNRSSISALLADQGGTGISLREAIEAVNNTNNASVDNISFNFSGGGPHIVSLIAGLPDINTPVNIDASGQTGNVILDGGSVGGSGLVLGGNADGSTIRGLIIRDFGSSGITIGAGSDNNVIQGNLIGSFDDLGNASTGAENGQGGVEVRGSNNLIGGLVAGQENILSGNLIYGIQIQGNADSNDVIGNFIGTTSTGLSAHANVDGIRLLGNAANTIIDQNTISGNSGYGIQLFNNASNNQITKNNIGAGADAVTNVGNALGGIRLIDSVSDNVVGGTTANSNIIAFNGGAGIVATASTSQNTFRLNQIHTNAGLGIDLDDNAVSETNDADDADPGANGLLNFPTLYTAVLTGGDLVLTGNFSAAANATFNIDIYVSSTADATGFGEGERLVGSFTITTDGSGDASISETFTSVSISAGEAISSVATDISGNTSEFSQNVIAATAVTNQAPVNVLPGTVRAEFNGSVIFSRATGNRISIADADAGLGVLRLQLTASNGTFSLGSLAGIGFGLGDGIDDTDLEIFGTLTELNAALDGLVFTPDTDFSGRASLTVDTNDQGNSGPGGPQVDSDTIEIEVGGELATTDAFVINSSTTGAQSLGSANNSVAILADGSYVVVWTDDETDGNSTNGVYGRIFAADGSVQVDEFAIATSTTGDQEFASVAADASGRFVVVWTAPDADGDGIYMRRFEMDGTAIDAGDVLVNSTTNGTQRNASIAINGSGQGLIVWEGNGPGDADGVFAQALTVSTGLSGSEMRINVEITGDDQNPAVAINESGDSVVVWQRDDAHIVARSLPGGALTESELIIISDTDLADPVVALAESGDFVVAYYYDQFFDATAYVAVSGTGSVGTPTFVPGAANKSTPSLATDGHGAYILAYRDALPADVDIVTVRFNAQGDLLGEPLSATISSGTNSSRPSVAMTDFDNFVVVWEQLGIDGDGSGISGRTYGSIASERLILTTSDASTASGVAFADAHVVSLGGDSLSLESPTTAGGASIILDMDTIFEPDVDVDGLHIVGSDMVVGSAGGFARLQKGDILFNVGGTTTLAGTPLELTRNDIAVARPIAGTTSLLVFILFDDLDDPLVAGMTLRAFTLVEQDTLIGDTIVEAGNLLFTPNGGARDKSIYIWHTDTVLAGTTTGTAELLIDGEDIGVEERIWGLELFEESLEIGGQVIGRGSIAISTSDGVPAYGSNAEDIFVVLPTATTLGSGTAVATGYLLFDGSDVGIDSSLDGFSLGGVHVNHAPVLTPTGSSIGSTDEDTATTPISVASILGLDATDSDNDFIGIAVTSTSGLGGWEYSIDGTNWLSIAGSSPSSSLLLGSDSVVRYTPNGINGETASITYRAWDQTSGSAGQIVDTTQNGGDTAFSLDSDTVSLTVVEINNAPSISLSGTVVSLPENTSTAATTKLADIVVSDDGTGLNVLTVNGPDLAFFQIMGSELHLRSGVTLDFESQETYSITVTVDDVGGGFTDSVSYLLTITDVNEAPELAFTQTLSSINENTSTASAMAIGDIVLTDDLLGTNTLSLSGADAASFDILGNSVVLRAGVTLDYEAKTEFSLSLVVDDSGIGAGPEDVIPITLTVVDVNDVRPVIDASQSFSISESAAVNDTVGTVTATDPDTVGVLWNWTIESGDTGGVFQIASGTGEITIADSSNLDYEGTQTYTLQISVFDGVQTSVFEDVVINVTDENDSRALILPGQSFTVSENAMATDVVGVAISTDADTVGTPSWTIEGGNADGIFAISAASGTITIADPSNLDYEANTSHTLQLSVFDGVQTSAFANVEILISDVNDVPPVVDGGQSFSISENAAVNDTVGTVSATDSDTVGSLGGWAIVGGNSDGIFGIGANTGLISIVDTTNLDFEATQTYSLQISVSDGVQTSAPEVVTIAVIDVNDTRPTVPGSQSFTISEAAVANDIVGTVVGNDLDTVGTLTNWQIESGNTDGIFQIDATSGEISIADPSNLDFEAVASHTLQVSVFDGQQTSAFQNVVIDIADANDVMPVVVASQLFDVNENAVVGDIVGTVVANDDDTVGTLSGWAIHNGNADGIFQIDASTGVISIADISNLDFEATETYTLEVSVTDGVQTSARRNISIAINDVDDTPPVVSTTRFTVSESQTIGFTIGTLSATDVDSLPPFGNWQITSGNSEGLFHLDPASGTLTLATPADYEHQQSYTLTVTASDGINTSLPSNIVVDIADANDVAPVILTGQVLSISEDATMDSVVGTVSATDVDSVGTLQGWQIVSGDDSDVFQIDAATGTISVANPGLLDHETQDTYTLQVGVSDGNQQTIEELTINVLDVAAEGSIGGRIYDDIDGDGIPGVNNTVAGARVDLYLDDGDGSIGSGDTLVRSLVTTSSGYNFAGLGSGTYYVVVDSRTITSTQDPGATDGTWAEQTWGSAGSFFRTEFTTADGAIYGGRRALRSDDASSLSSAEHIIRVNVDAGLVDATFGFSFNVVTNVLGGDTQDDDLTSDRTVQGSLRQFIQNANAINAASTMRFAPRVGTTSSDADANEWWTIDVTSALPAITNDNTTIDGTAWGIDNTIRDTNGNVLGRNQAVGLGIDGIAGTADDVYISQIEGVELEILNDRDTTPVNFGLDIAGDNVAVRNVAITGFGLTTEPATANIRVTGQDFLIENSVIGSTADSFTRPETADRTVASNIAVFGANFGIVRNNVIGFSGSWGIQLNGNADGWHIEGNEFNQSSMTSAGQDAINIQRDSGDTTIIGNFFANSGGSAIDMFRSDGGNIITDNLIRNSGRLNTEVAGIRLWGIGNTVSQNVIVANEVADGTGGAGIVVVGGSGTDLPSSGNTISRNHFGDNGGPAIDLVSGGQSAVVNRRGDGATDTAGYDLQSGNLGVDAPQFESVTETEDVVRIEGVALANSTVEIYSALGSTGSVFLTTVEVSDTGRFVVDVEGIAEGTQLTATATDSDGNTSEFGTVTAINPAPEIVSAARYRVQENITAVATLLAEDTSVPVQPLTWTLAGGTDEAIFTITTDGTLSFRSAPDFELPTDANADNVYEVIVVVTDALGAEDTSVVSVSVTPQNDHAPVINSATRVQVPETQVSILTITASDADLPGDALTYSIGGGADASAFEINETNGLLSFRNQLDFETDQQLYVVTVVATDSGGLSTNQSVQVQVTDVNDEAPQLLAQTLQVSEAVANGDLVGRVLATDADTVGGSLTFVITSGDAGIFEIDSDTGEIVVSDASGLNYETTSRYELIVEVSDQTHTTTQTFVVEVVDENESPTAIVLNGTSIEENAAGTIVGTLAVVDPDVGSHTFTVDDSRFEIDGETLRLSDGVSVNFETEPTIAIVVTATDAGGLSVDETFEIQVININESPSSITIDNTEVAEDVQGAEVGRVTVEDSDQLDRHTITVNDNRFEVADGTLRLKQGVALNYETERFVDIEVVAEDSSGATLTQAIRVQVLDRSIEVVEELKRTIEEDTPAISWDLASVFSIETGELEFTVEQTPKLGRLQVVDGKLLFRPDADAFGQETIRVFATSSGSESASADLLIDITPVNDAPVAKGPGNTVVLPGGLSFNPLAAGNAIDVDDSSLRAELVGLPANGQLIVDPDGQFTYRPNDNFSGTDTFSYEVVDAGGLSSLVEVELTVGGVVFQQNVQTVVEDQITISESSTNETPIDESSDPDTSSSDLNPPSTAVEGTPPTTTSDQEQKKNIFNPLLQEASDSDEEQELVGGLIPLRTDSASAEEQQRRDSRTDTLGVSQSGSEQSFELNSRAIAQNVVEQQRRVLSRKTTTQLDQALDQVTEDLEKPRMDQVVFGTASVSLGGFSVGYILWLLRGGSLVASMLTSIPAWRMIDPLPVLDFLESSDEDGDSLDSLIDRNQKLVSANASLANQEGN